MSKNQQGVRFGLEYGRARDHALKTTRVLLRLKHEGEDGKQRTFFLSGLRSIDQLEMVVVSAVDAKTAFVAEVSDLVDRDTLLLINPPAELVRMIETFNNPPGTETEPR